MKKRENMKKDHTQTLNNLLKVYDKIKSEKESYSAIINGKKIIILPNVFSPKYFIDGDIFSKEIPKIVKNKRLLEIGVGTGIISLFCAKRGAKVVGTDINPDAVKNCKFNARKWNVRIDCRKGDLFKPIKKNEKFDFIFWNHPFTYSNTPPKEMLLKAGFDYKYGALKRF